MNANVKNNTKSRVKHLINSKETIDISSLLCQVCGSSLLLNYITETKYMLTCSNPRCIFPFNSEDMKRYICQSNDLEGFIRSISKMLSRPSTHDESQSDNQIYFNEINEMQEEEENERVFSDDFY